MFFVSRYLLLKMPQAPSPEPSTYRNAIIGPESTGKSELAADLARYYDTVWVSEYAREYLPDLDRDYTYDDILLIAERQYELELKMIPRSRQFIFCDTEFIVLKIWCEDKFEMCHPWILEMIENHPYDLYLLCDIDLAWESDPLRENQHDRDRLLELYTYELESRKLPYVLITGAGSARLKMAIEAITQHSTPKNLS